MGALSSKSGLVIKVRTGDQIRAGTDANVRIRLHTDSSKCSKPIKLNNLWKNDFERGQLDTFNVSKKHAEALGKGFKLKSIEIWRDDAGIGSSWFVDTITVEHPSDAGSISRYVFPVFRWIKGSYHYRISHLDTSLPQFEEFPDQRKEELEDKRRQYEYAQHIKDGPVQVKNLPEDETFSFSYQWDILALKMSLIVKTKIKNLFKSEKFKSIDSILELYHDVLEAPRDPDGWKKDVYFGHQRIACHNNIVIELATEIPEKFPVTDAVLGGLLKGLSLKDAIAHKRMFICDYQIMDGMPSKPGYQLCHPIGLFFVNDDGDLVPVAIQLYQKPGPKNPIFTPEDPALLWSLVKMWFNCADATFHQAVSHLTHTHFMMEGVAITTHRTLSHSHPMFKLMAPHFLYVIAINSRGVAKLLPEGGWFDCTMASGVVGAFELAKRAQAKWALDVDGSFPEYLKSRGLADPKVLPGYHYREDGLDLYRIVNKYVSSYVNHYYKCSDLLKEDEEIQAWAHALVAERGLEGLGLKGVPGNGQLTTNEQLVQIVTCVIYTCSVNHAAVNFPQYSQYCYPPNYPGLLYGNPPKSKDMTVTEEDILKALPDRTQTLDMMVVTRILSNKGTRSLGDFEVQYIYDPEAQPFVDQFRNDLQEISRSVKERNKTRKCVYDCLDPEFIPNSISI